MMIVMKSTATDQEVQAVIDRVEAVGARTHLSRGEEVTVIGAIGDREHVARLELEGAPGVDRVRGRFFPARSGTDGGDRFVVDAPRGLAQARAATAPAGRDNFRGDTDGRFFGGTGAEVQSDR